MLPPDLHTHSEFSWDTTSGDMEGSCARAVQLGLPAIAFTEHTDFATWTVDPVQLPPSLRQHVHGDALSAPALDVDGYFATLQRCRERFPALRIIAGIELGEPHWFPAQAGALLASAPFERVLGSLHSLRVGDAIRTVEDGFVCRPVADVLRDYFAEMVRMIEGPGAFAALAHIDYPLRSLPPGAAFRPEDFEEELRSVLRALAGTGRALEVNTQRRLEPQILRWWRESGGRAVSFGSDAHYPDDVAAGFADAGALVQAHGFRPGRQPYEHWLL